MKKFIRLLILFTAGFLLALQPAAGQVDEIIKPADIFPPKPTKVTDEQLAGEYFRNHDFEKAAGIYKTLWEVNASPVYYSFYIYCLVGMKDYKEAEKAVKKQIRTYPSSPRYLVDLGYIYSSQGEINKARKQYEEALKKIIPDKQQIIELANSFLMRGETDFAIETYLKGRQEMKDYPFHIELGNLYSQLGNYSGMIAEYLNDLEYDPYNAQLVRNRLQSMIDEDEDGAISEILRKSLLIRIQAQPQMVVFSEMLIWLSIQQKDFEMALLQARSLDKRLNEDGGRVYELAELAGSNQDFNTAVEAYEYILKKGKNNRLYLPAKIGLLNTKYERIMQSDNADHEALTDLEKEYNEALDDFGRSSITTTLMRYLAHLQAFHLEKPVEAISLLEDAIGKSPDNSIMHAECKIELADILLFTGDVWEATLLYSQVEKAFKNEPVGHYARLKNARLSFYIGEFNWAKAQLDVLKAATSKLIANDALELSLLISDNLDYDTSTVALRTYARADLLSFRNYDDLAIITLDSLIAMYQWHPILDEALFKKAEISLKTRQYEKAAGYLQEIMEKYPYDIKADNALFLLAGLYETKFMNREKAMELYLRLMTEYKASVFVAQSRARYRTLRGEPGDDVTPEEKFFFELN
ncbi:MAG: tetratricopeptide repeat protein [Bacteroidales bacterium]|nr:tetratricopeptide repeat protein [Bacteroidales bacterium]